MNSDDALDDLAPPPPPPPPMPVYGGDQALVGYLSHISRASFGVAAAGCGLGALLLLLLSPRNDAVLALAATYAVLAVVAGLGSLLPHARRVHGLAALMLGITVTLGFTAQILGGGLAAPGLSVLGLLVGGLSALAGWRMGLMLAAVAVLALLGIAADWPLARAVTVEVHSPEMSGMRLGVHLLLVAIGLAGGVLFSRMVERSVAAAAERGQHFRGLLALAADGYWEIDEAYRLVAATYRNDDSRRLTPETGLGAVPWELERFSCDAETLDLLLADLDSRLPFHELPMQWRTSDGQLRRFLASGEPRFNARGVFTGYRGILRDVTADLAARTALAATETRYQELFTRTPTPLVLHRSGHVLDANDAALVLFGFARLEDMLGRDLLVLYEPGDSLDRARASIADLQSRAAGAALPVADFHLLVRGRRVTVRAAGVRLDTDSGPAVLSIFVDDTDRRAAEEAVRRSEAMLSHLVATSPDLITLTEMASGRYVMVNHAFERISGFSAKEAVGKTSLELGVWPQASDREQFVQRLKRDGAVTDLPVTFGTKSGSEVSLLVSAARFAMDRRDYLVINARDVNEGERARLEREAILANASVGIAVTRDRRFVLANRCFEAMFGWGAGELIGQPGLVVWGGAAEYAEVGAAMGPKLARGEQAECERTGVRTDGSKLLLRVLGRAIDPKNPIHGGTVWIVEDVTERRQAEQALARARDDAEAASRAKSAFLANTSHELRTPLNGMIGLAQLARQPNIDEERRSQYLDQIAESAQSLAGIISDILDLSKIEAGKLQVDNTPFDLGALLRSLERAYMTLASAHDLYFTLELDPGADGTVHGDPLRVRQIVTNFLTNAIKFTRQGGVTLAASRDGDAVRIEVRDTGAGIDEATQSRLFMPFTQADQSTTRRFGGTGLGLSICRELATLMGGEVGVRSSAGMGSVFWATLPLLATQPLAPAPVAGDEQALVGASVLMVEDNPVNMMIAVAVLQGWGIEVEEAQDGQQALLAVQRAAREGRPFDAVLMDVQMPVMSGHEATRALRRTEEGRQLPIIALTAAALVTERDEALASGMNDFLTKPIDIERLRAALVSWIRLRV